MSCEFVLIGATSKLSEAGKGNRIMGKDDIFYIWNCIHQNVVSDFTIEEFGEKYKSSWYCSLCFSAA